MIPNDMFGVEYQEIWDTLLWSDVFLKDYYVVTVGGYLTLNAYNSLLD